MSSDQKTNFYRLGVIQPIYYRDLLSEWRQKGLFERWSDPLPSYNPADDNYDIDFLKEIIKKYTQYLKGLLIQAGEKGIDLVLLPENCIPGGVCKKPDYIEENEEIFVFGPSYYLNEIRATAVEYKMIIASCFTRKEEDGIFNICHIMDEEGQTAGVYRKTHLPNAVDEGHSEAGTLKIGKELNLIETTVGSLGCLICYDINFPEAAATYAMLGADILLHPTVGYNYPDEEASTARARLKTRATDSHIPLLYSNFGHIGRGSASESCIINRSGTMVANAGRAEEAVVFSDVVVGGERMKDWCFEGYEHRRWLAAKRRPELYFQLIVNEPVLLEKYLPPRPVYPDDSD